MLKSWLSRHLHWRKKTATVVLFFIGLFTLLAIIPLIIVPPKQAPGLLFWPYSIVLRNLSGMESVNFVAPAFMRVSSDQDNILQEPTLVLICLGENGFTRHQQYIWTALEQARLIGPNLSIVVILNSVQPVIVHERLRQLNVAAVFYENLLINYGMLISEFHRAFFVQGSLEPDGNTLFVQYTTERLLALHAYMNATRRWNVFHIENDNMLYVNLSDLMHHMHACNVYFGLPKAAPHTAVTSFVYVRNPDSAEHFVRYVIEIFRLGRRKAIDYLNNSWINDMTLAGRYLDLFAATSAQSNSTGVFELPTQFNGDCCLCGARKESAIIFDACVLGQYFGGPYSNPGIPHWEPTRLVDPRGHILVWKEIDSRRRVPYIQGMRIVNIHVHSKHLEEFSSIGTNQTTGIGFRRRHQNM